MNQPGISAQTDKKYKNETSRNARYKKTGSERKNANQWE